jgi:hypothetical protein
VLVVGDLPYFYNGFPATSRQIVAQRRKHCAPNLTCVSFGNLLNQVYLHSLPYLAFLSVMKQGHGLVGEVLV